MSLRSAICFFLLAALLAACSPTRRLPEGQVLLKKNTVVCPDRSISRAELAAIIKQKPNRKILGLFRFHLGVYNLGSRGRETKFRKWLKNTVGEEPVVLDSVLTDRTVRQLGLFLHNEGYFHAQVTDSVIVQRRKARVLYLVDPGRAYTLRGMTYDINDRATLQVVHDYAPMTLLKPGARYAIDLLEAERKRITDGFRERGYYFFAKEYIFYRVDSALGSGQVDVYLGIRDWRPAAGTPDTSDAGRHRPYVVRNVFVYPGYKPLEKGKVYSDTLLHDGYVFVFDSLMRYKPEAIRRTLFITPGQSYYQPGVDRTYRRLAGLKQFRFINVVFTGLPDSAGRQLDGEIHLTPTAFQSFSVETEGTHTSGNLGIAGNLVYRHKNAFRGAEILEARMKVAVEAQKSLNLENDSIGGGRSPFNTMEVGPELLLQIPRFVLPFYIGYISRYYDPRTNIMASYGYQRRTDYTRWIANATFGYKWKETEKKGHIFNPAEISFVKVFLDPATKLVLEQRNDIFLLNSYADHMTASTNYSFLFSSQQVNRNTDFTFFRGDVEVAGNLLRGINKALRSADTGDGYRIFNVRYAQYVKAGTDYRYYWIRNAASSAVFRISLWAGFAYGNFHVLPLEESFFGGGANGLRAWRIRTLGPGSYTDAAGLDQAGDIRLEANAEYRFDILKMLKGAFFADAGNIWLLRSNERRPGGLFEWNRFHREIALGMGMGLRFDFSFFIIRFDLGMKAYDPAFSTGNRWVLPHVFDKAWKDNYLILSNKRYDFFNLNLGIGYPF